MLTSIIGGTVAAKAIQWVLSGIVSKLSGVIINILDTATTQFLNLVSFDPSKFREVFPFFENAYSTVKIIAICLAILIFCFQILKVMLGPLTETEHPLKMTVRFMFTLVSIFMCIQIEEIVIKLANLGYEAFLSNDSLEKTTKNMWDNYSGGILTGLNGKDADVEFISAPFLLTMIVAIVIGWNFIKLLLEIIERYVVFWILTMLSPMGFAPAATAATNNIFKAFLRMYLSEMLLIMLNGWFVRGFITSIVKLSTMSFTGKSWSALFGALLLISYLKICQNFDRYLSQLGLNTVQTGGMLAAEVAAAGAMVKRSGDKMADAFTGGRGGMLGAATRSGKDFLNKHAPTIMGSMAYGKKGSLSAAGEAVKSKLEKNGAFKALGDNATAADKHNMSQMAAIGQGLTQGNFTQKQVGQNMGDVMRGSVPMLANQKLSNVKMSEGSMSANIGTAAGNAKFSARVADGNMKAGEFAFKDSLGNMWYGSMGGNAGAVETAMTSIAKNSEQLGLSGDMNGRTFVNSADLKAGASARSEQGFESDAAKAVDETLVSGGTLEGEMANQGILDKINAFEGMTITAGSIDIGEDGMPVMSGVATMEDGTSAAFSMTKLGKDATAEEKANAVEINGANGPELWAMSLGGEGVSDEAKNAIASAMSASAESQGMNAVGDVFKTGNTGDFVSDASNERDIQNAANGVAKVAGYDSAVGGFDDSGSFVVTGTDEEGNPVEIARFSADESNMVDGQPTISASLGDGSAKIEGANSIEEAMQTMTSDDFGRQLIEGGDNGAVLGSLDGDRANEAMSSMIEMPQGATISDSSISTKLNDEGVAETSITGVMHKPGDDPESPGTAFSLTGSEGNWTMTTDSGTLTTSNLSFAAAMATGNEKDFGNVAAAAYEGKTSELGNIKMSGEACDKVLQNDMNKAEGVPKLSDIGNFTNTTFDNGKIDTTFASLGGGNAIQMTGENTAAGFSVASGYSGGTTIRNSADTNPAGVAYEGEDGRQMSMRIGATGMTESDVGAITSGERGSMIVEGGAASEYVNSNTDGSPYSNVEMSRHGVAGNLSTGTEEYSFGAANSENGGCGVSIENNATGEYSQIHFGGESGNVDNKEVYASTAAVMSSNPENLATAGNNIREGNSNIEAMSGSVANKYFEAAGGVTGDATVSEGYVSKDISTYKYNNANGNWARVTTTVSGSHVDYYDKNNKYVGGADYATTKISDVQSDISTVTKDSKLSSESFSKNSETMTNNSATYTSKSSGWAYSAEKPSGSDPSKTISVPDVSAYKNSGLYITKSSPNANGGGSTCTGYIETKGGTAEKPVYRMEPVNARKNNDGSYSITRINGKDVPRETGMFTVPSENVVSKKNIKKGTKKFNKDNNKYKK